MKKLKPFKVDIAVALIFFNRPEVFKPVFDAVAAARPSRLYLIQDGARAHRPDDKVKIMECRDITKNIDWDCEVYTDYSEINLGCGQRIFTGLSYVFQKEEYAAIVEDDIKIGESFLLFCKEMCERFKDDLRIQMISGMNHIGIYEDCPYDYFFAKCGGAIWGWATWARVWNELDWNMKIVSNPYYQRCLEYSLLPDNRGKNEILKRSLEVRNNILNGKAPSFWSLHLGLYDALGSRLNVVPKYNLISNIGITAESAHATNSIKKVVKRLRKVFYAPIYDMPVHLKHPEFVTDDEYYMRMQDAIMRPRRWQRFVELFELIRIKIFIR